MQGAALSIPVAEQSRLISLYEIEAFRARRPASIATPVNFDLRWYVVRVSPLCEKAVANRLARWFDPAWSPSTAPWNGLTSANGVVAYAPTFRRRRKVGQRKDTVTHVLMPGYLFVGFDAPPPWLYLADIPGLQSVLGFDDRPAELSAQTVGDLMLRCETGRLDPPPPPKLQRGMSVVATGGIYRGYEGSVAHVRKQTEEVDVLFGLFSRMPVTLPLDDVASVAYASDRLHG